MGKGKDTPQFPLSTAQLQAVEELLPSLRVLEEEWRKPIAKLHPFMKDRPAVKFVDRMCFEYAMPVKRTLHGRLEYLLASIIQSKSPPEKVIEHCMDVLGDAVLNLSGDFSTQFVEVANHLLQLREVWQGPDKEDGSSSEPASGDASDEHSDSNEEPENAEPASSGAASGMDVGGPKHSKGIKCQKCGTMGSSQGQFCRHCGEQVVKFKSHASHSGKGKAAPKCPCGMRFFDEAKFCAACGKARPSGGSILIKCSQCAHLLPRGQPFCQICGQSNAKGLTGRYEQGPSYVYNEVTGQLVDTKAPMKRPFGSVPKDWTPHPPLSFFKMPKDAPTAEKCHVKDLLQIHGQLYQAAHDGVVLRIPSTEKPTLYDDLDPLQKALCLVEGALHCYLKVHTLHMSWKQAKRSTGYTDEVYSLEHTQKLCTQIVAEDKMERKFAKHTQSKDSKDRKWEHQLDNSKKKWQKGKDFYAQNGKRGDSEQPKSEQSSAMSQEALQALSKRTQQLEAALNKGGHVKVDPKKGGF